jgi:hypothetical protein
MMQKHHRFFTHPAHFLRFLDSLSASGKPHAAIGDTDAAPTAGSTNCQSGTKLDTTPAEYPSPR